jgi:hypothetical protein
MNGTRAEATRPSHRMPPRTTSPTATKMTRPVHEGVQKVSSGSWPWMAVATCPDWTALPMPKLAITPKTANAKPRILPSGPRMPSVRYHIGPPDCSPRALTRRYLTPRSPSEYLVAMPNRPVTHIQNRAPGPPMAMAAPTPPMLPTPTVAASATDSAW